MTPTSHLALASLVTFLATVQSYLEPGSLPADVPVTICLAAKDKGHGIITTDSQYAKIRWSQDCLTIAAIPGAHAAGSERFEVDLGPALTPSCYIKGDRVLQNQRAVTFYFQNSTDGNYLNPCFGVNGFQIMCDSPPPSCQKWRAAV